VTHLTSCIFTNIQVEKTEIAGESDEESNTNNESAGDVAEAEHVRAPTRGRVHAPN
jgi:hypothetical protein